MSDAPTPTRKVPFWLVLSLLANMLLVGLLAGLVLKPGPLGPGDGRGPPRIVWSERDGHSEAVGQAFRQAYMASEAEREVRARARKLLGEAVAKDPYDVDAVRAAFETLRQADDAVNTAMQEAMTERFATLSAEDRKRVALFLEHGPRGRERRRLRPGEPGAGPDGLPPPPEDGGPRP